MGNSDSGSDNNDSSESVSIWAPISSKGTGCSNGSFRAHESVCTSYYQCVNGQWAESRCPGGLYWNRVRTIKYKIAMANHLTQFNSNFVFLQKFSEPLRLVFQYGMRSDDLII